ncbi:MAG: hypothetical protein IPL01_24195 [Acidobacteria bacterium]|nr:hypothetical protein [Acidobacteriota bacterium]
MPGSSGLLGTLLDETATTSVVVTTALLQPETAARQSAIAIRGIIDRAIVLMMITSSGTVGS